MIPTLLQQFAINCQNNPTFLGLVPWYKYLDRQEVTPISGQPYCQIKDFVVLKAGERSDIPLVLLAIVDDLLRLAGLVAVIFVIYGAVQYATSQGNPEQTSRAQSTVLNSLIGLAIAVTAVAFVSFIGNRLT